MIGAGVIAGMALAESKQGQGALPVAPKARR
jgi:hypothetical protein